MHSFSRLFSFAVLSVLIAAPVADALAQGGERFRSFWRGQWVDYVEVGDYAITEGDIIIGHKDDVRAWREAVERGQAWAAEQAKALTIDQAFRLWNVRDGSGVIIVPYTIEAGDAAVIEGAVREVNDKLSGVLRLVPRTSQADYIAFDLSDSVANTCFSRVGRVGGRQRIWGRPDCTIPIIVHEIGHALGLWHVQQDAHAKPFLQFFTEWADPQTRASSEALYSTRTLNGYDYASIMHYPRAVRSRSTEHWVTHETKPAGIDISVSSLSAADIDALKRLYGRPTARTTVTTHPPGLKVVVDGTEVVTPATFDWPIGSVHRLWVPEGLRAKDGFSFAFGRWSQDPSREPSALLTWEVRAGDGQLGSPRDVPSDTVLTANFIRLIDVRTTPETAAGGRSLVRTRGTPWPGTGTLYPQFSVFDLSVTPAAGFDPVFTWSDAYLLSGRTAFSDRATIQLTGALSAQTIGGQFVSRPSLRVLLEGPGTDSNVRIRYTPPNGTLQSRARAPRISTASGVHRIERIELDAPLPGVRFRTLSISGLDDPIQGTVTATPEAPRTVTVRAQREVKPYRQVIPGCAGSISVTPGDEWVVAGSTLAVTLQSSGIGVFTGWEASLSGRELSKSYTVGLDQPEFRARFNTIAEPLELHSVSPDVVGDERGLHEFVLRGRGFTPSSLVVVGQGSSARTLRPAYVSSGELRVSVARADMVAGRHAVTVENGLSDSCAVASNSLPVDVLPAGQAAVVTLTEYYNAAFDYYFITGREADKRALDAAPGWRRTGQEIRLPALWLAENQRPLERFFFSQVARGGARGSHFYTLLTDESALLRDLNARNEDLVTKPKLEGIEGYPVVPSPSGSCPASTVPVYRAFKAAPRYPDDGNHRFTTSLTVHRDMVDRLGWADEGVRFCALP